MGGPLETRIKRLQEFYWSDADPDGRGFVSLADAHRKEGDFLEALRILRDGLRRHPEVSSGHVVRGWIYAGQGDTADAEAAFRAALDVDPQNVAALRGLGDILAQRGDVSEASEVLRRLMSLDPLDADLPRQVAELDAAAASTEIQESDEDVLRELPAVWEDPDSAAEELNWDAAALQADESRGLEVQELPGTLDAEGEAPPTDVAPAAIAQAEDALVTRTMGDIFLRQGLLDEAEDIFRRLLERDPGDPGLASKLEEVGRRRAEKALPDTGPLRTQDLKPDDVVPIQEFLAEPIVAIEDLAPGLVVEVDDLSPDVVVPIQILAPDQSHGSEGDATLDAFEAWLDKLQ